MMFLLKYSSIFIPLPTNNHHQVTGLPLNKVLQTPDPLHNPKIPVSLSKDLLPERQPADNGNFCFFLIFMFSGTCIFLRLNIYLFYFILFNFFYSISFRKLLWTALFVQSICAVFM